MPPDNKHLLSTHAESNYILSERIAYAVHHIFCYALYHVYHLHEQRYIYFETSESVVSSIRI
jgi:hypothetical protein